MILRVAVHVVSGKRKTYDYCFMIISVGAEIFVCERK